jgi:uncharacterized membrane protein YdjX (TVP38/TMEM64 family)
MEIKNIGRKIYGRFKELGSLTPIALATTFLPVLGSATLLVFAVSLGNWLKEYWEVGSPLFFLGTLFFCGLSLLPTNVIGIISGWAFGFDLGILLLISGIVSAAFLSFSIHSRIVGNKLPEVFDTHPRAKAVYEALIGQSVWRTTLVIFLIRLSPAMPFALTNFLLASARVPLKSFLLGTFLGMLPRSSAVVLVGSTISELDFNNPQNSWLLIVGIAATLISVIVLGNISKHALDRLTTENQTA